MVFLQFFTLFMVVLAGGDSLKDKRFSLSRNLTVTGIFAQGDEKQITVSTSPSSSQVGRSSRMVVLAENEDAFVKALRNEDVVQLAMF